MYEKEREVELFGGAITCAIPATLVDMSDVRQVPDTQEVHADHATGMCVIVELFARQREVSDENSGAFFFSDLARANECAEENCVVETLQVLAAQDYPHVSQRCLYGCLICGIQRISKFRNEQGKENDVFIALAILRFPPPVSSDVLLSISAPQYIHPESSEARVVQGICGKEEVMEIMRRMLLTFNVRDWDLFVPED